jgi:hypothetical protein
MKIYLISSFLLLASLTGYAQNQTIANKLPTSFYGKWYSTDGNNVWGFHITKDFFRTNNIHYKFLQVIENSDYYTVLIGMGTERRTYYLKEANSGYIYISGLDRNFKLFKNSPNKSNSLSSSGTSKNTSKLPTSFYGKWYSTDGNNVWGFQITQDFFRTNNIHYKFIEIINNSDYYTVKIGMGAERRTYLLKEAKNGYIYISGSDRNFKLFKDSPNRSNSLSPSSNLRGENNFENDKKYNAFDSKTNKESSINTTLYIYSTSWEYGSCYDKDRDGYKSTCCLTIDIRANRLDKMSPENYSGYYKFYYKKSYESNYRLLFTSETYTNIKTSTFGFFRCASIGYRTYPLEHGEYDFKIELFDEQGIIQEVRDASMDVNLYKQKFELYYGNARGEE